MREVLAPDPFPSDTRSVFLAGSIDMGSATNWQATLAGELADLDGVVLNPRRPAWDSSWAQVKDNPEFRGQVEWELRGLEQATVIAMWFEPTSQAPITLLELGLWVRSGKVVVGCPPGYWRRGNVDIVCERYGATMVPDWTGFVALVRARLGS
jgi:hypothetical protein